MARMRKKYRQGAMAVSVSADVRAMRRDLKRVKGDIVPRLVPSVINTVARRRVEAPAMRDIAKATKLPLGVVRFKHTDAGTRTSTRRLGMTKATRELWSARWRWATRDGAAGSVPLATVPGRRQTRTGVRAGKYTVRSGFIQDGRGGRSVVFKRRGRARYPIDAQSVPMTREADAAFSRRVAGAKGPFVSEMERRLAKRLARKG